MINVSHLVSKLVPEVVHKYLSSPPAVRDSPLTEPDPQSLRDEILHREPSRFPRSHHQPDKGIITKLKL